MSRDRAFKHSTTVRTPSAIVLIDASRLKKALLLPSSGILLLLPFILALFDYIIPEPKLIVYSHIASVLGSLKPKKSNRC